MQGTVGILKLCEDRVAGKVGDTTIVSGYIRHHDLDRLGQLLMAAFFILLGKPRVIGDIRVKNSSLFAIQTTRCRAGLPWFLFLGIDIPGDDQVIYVFLITQHKHFSALFKIQNYLSN